MGCSFILVLGHVQTLHCSCLALPYLFLFFQNDDSWVICLFKTSSACSLDHSASKEDIESPPDAYEFNSRCSDWLFSRAFFKGSSEQSRLVIDRVRMFMDIPRFHFLNMSYKQSCSVVRSFLKKNSLRFSFGRSRFLNFMKWLFQVFVCIMEWLFPPKECPYRFFRRILLCFLWSIYVQVFIL